MLAAHGSPPRPRREPRARSTRLPRLVAAYRLLAVYLQQEAAAGRPARVLAWEAPWVRRYQAPARAKLRQVVLPAAALVRERTRRGAQQLVLVLPDLGTAPVVRSRTVLGRLLELRATRDWATPGAAVDASMEPMLLVGTPNPPPLGARPAAWISLVRRVAQRQGEPPPRLALMTWSPRDPVTDASRNPQPPRPARRADQVLELVGRHPFLSVAQLADLLDVTHARAARLVADLAAPGWLRLVRPGDSATPQLSLSPRELAHLRLVEITGSTTAGDSDQSDLSCERRSAVDPS
jgi:hypothetical protein